MFNKKNEEGFAVIVHQRKIHLFLFHLILIFLFQHVKIKPQSLDCQYQSMLAFLERKSLKRFRQKRNWKKKFYNDNYFYLIRVIFVEAIMIADFFEIKHLILTQFNVEHYAVQQNDYQLNDSKHDDIQQTDDQQVSL